MPDNTPAKLVFAGKEISDAEAIEKLKAIYGVDRAPKIVAGIRDGTHRCASVAGGYIQILKS